MSAPTSTDWVNGYLAFIDAEGRTKAYSREPVRWDGHYWDSLVGRGAWSPQYVTSVTPLYMVSLDAAIEAAAKADHEKIDSEARAPWETCPERWRAGLRDKWRPIITAAVMGGAQ